MINIREKFWRLVRPARNAVRKARQRPRVGHIDWGDFDTTRPINANWGYERGAPIDRYYIGGFLKRYAGDIRGRVLEVADNEYTKTFGGARVEKSDILYPTKDNPRATIIADLTIPDQVTEKLFDCIICTQTLQFIFDVRVATASLFRFLKPGGVLLLTVPGITKISPEDRDRSGDFWRFTAESLQRLLATEFPEQAVTVETQGNVKSSLGLLHGISAGEIPTIELDQRDDHYPLLVSARAVRPR
jgi:SAM-dependent methyltransferase